MREDALRNERSELFYAEKKGLEKGLKQGLEKGRKEIAAETAVNLLSMDVLTPEQIAQATGLSVQEVRKLQKKKKAGKP